MPRSQNKESVQLTVTVFLRLQKAPHPSRLRDRAGSIPPTLLRLVSKRTGLTFWASWGAEGPDISRQLGLHPFHPHRPWGLSTALCPKQSSQGPLTNCCHPQPM